MFQRRAPRVPVQLKAVLDDGDRYATVGVKDLSETGLFATGDAAMEEGTILKIIPLDDVALPEFDAQVVRTAMPADTDMAATTPGGLGLQFCGLTAQHRAQVRAFCREQRAFMADRLKATPDPVADVVALPVAHTQNESTEGIADTVETLTPERARESVAEHSPVPEVTDSNVLYTRAPAANDDVSAANDLAAPAITERVRKAPPPTSSSPIRLWPLLVVQLLTVVVIATALYALERHQSALIDTAQTRLGRLESALGATRTELGQSLQQQGTTLAALAAAAEGDGPTLTHDVRIEPLVGTDKAAVILNQRLAHDGLAPHRVDFARTRVYRAEIPPGLKQGKQGLVELSGVDTTALHWVAMRDVVARAQDATLADYHGGQRLTERLTGAAPTSMTGALAPGGAHEHADAFLITVAPDTLLHIVTDVGVRSLDPEAGAPKVISQSTLHFVQ